MSHVSILDAMVAGSGSAPLPLPDATPANAEASNLRALPFARRELFSDHRGRGLRASWHPERGLVVLSLWKDDLCAGTVHLGPDDAVRLAAFLDAARGTDGPGNDGHGNDGHRNDGHDNDGHGNDGHGDAASGADATVPLQVLRGE